MANTVVRLCILLLLFAVVAYGQRRSFREVREEQYEEYEKYEETYEERMRRDGGDRGRSKRDVQPYLQKFHAASFLKASPKLKSN